MKVDLMCFLLLSLNSFNEVCMVAVLSSSFFSMPLILSILLSTFFNPCQKVCPVVKDQRNLMKQRHFQIHSVVGLVA